MKSVPDQAALALALIENIQREDLNPLEEAQGLKRLIDEFGLTHERPRKAVGRSRSAVTNLLRLTQLAKPVQDYLIDGALEMGHARALLALPAAQQVGTAARVVNGGAVGARDRAARAPLLHPAKRAARRARARDAGRRHAAPRNRARRKARREGAHRAGRKGAGRVVIRYTSLDELDGILARIK